MNVDYSFIRPDIRDALDAWGREAFPVGGFLTAVLENNLSEALGRADEYNLKTIFHIVSYVYNELPSHCWGSPKNVSQWQRRFKNEAANS